MRLLAQRGPRGLARLRDLSAARARVYPVELAGAGRPVPGGGSVAFVARLSSADFGPGAARILSSGVIKAPVVGR